MYHVKWIVEDRVVLLRPVGDQTVDTLQDGIQRLIQHLNEGKAPIHVINDNTYLERFPTNPKALGKFRVLSGHPHAGYVVSIGDNHMTRFIGLMLAKVSGSNHVEFKDTLADALFLLKTLDPTLPEDFGCEHPARQEPLASWATLP